MPVDEGEGYESFDPASVRASAPEPPPSSDDTSGASDSQESTDEAEVDSNLAFDERHVEPFTGLLYLGALRKTFKWMGHTFTIRTLGTDEQLAIGLLVKEWDDSIAQNRAYSAAVVAAAVETVDGQPLPGPAFEETDEARLRRRFNVVTSTWYDATIDAVFNEYLNLRIKVDEILAKMGEAYGQAA